MPTSYLGRFSNKRGLQGTILRAQNIFYDPKLGIRDTSKDVTEKIPFDFTPVRVDNKLHKIPSGWEHNTDRMIWVDPDLDISIRSDFDADRVIINDDVFLVTHVDSQTLIRHGYKIVGLQALSDGEY